MHDGPRGVGILRIFAARALAEVERLRTENALRAREAQFRDLYEEAPVAYCSVGVDARIRRWNRRVVEMLGYAPEALPAAAEAPAAKEAAPTVEGVPPALNAVERHHIVTVLKETGWRIDGPNGAARLLDMKPSTLRSRMQKLGIRRSAEDRS
jgi:transcriptional regulator with GAF, ATPase, and Fis domain